MKKFAKSVLNFFTTFNETRFRFNKKLLYEWSNDSLTLDFSVFPDFQNVLLASVTEKGPLQFSIAKGQ